MKSAQRIVKARRNGNLCFEDLKRIGVVLEAGAVFYYLQRSYDV